MAKLEMTKITALAMRRDRKKLVKRLQEMGCIQITEIKRGKEEAEPFSRVPDPEEIRDLEAALSLLAFALEKLQKLEPVKRGLLYERPTADEQAVERALAGRAGTLEACRRIRALDARAAELAGQNGRLAAERETLAPLERLDQPLGAVRDTANVALGLYAVENRRVDALCRAAGALPLLTLEELGREQEAHIFLVAYHKSEARAAKLLMEQEAKRLSFRQTGVPAEEMAALDAQRRENEAEIGRCRAETAAMAARRAEMELLHDVLSNELLRERAAEAFAGTRQAFMLSGWVQKESWEGIRGALAGEFESLVLFESEPERGEEAPVSLRNSRLVAPYEFITDMFSSPGQGDIDPNAMMMPFFVAFFGMMVSDAGYGILLSLLCVAGLKVFKLKGGIGSIAKILTLGGVLTLFWGAMFGTWFGFELPPLLLNPLQQPVEMLVLCFALGGVHLLTGMGIKAHMLIRAGKFLDALGGQLSWFMIFGGGLMQLAPALSTAGLVLLAAGVACLLLFSDNSAGFNVVKRLSAGLGALYGVTGYLSDVLSYARLFAMGLATGVIGSVINTIVGMVWGNPIGYVAGVVIFVGGHVFNLAINALGAYVHASRLQYIEFYGKFYEGGGELFHPLRRVTSYVEMK